MFEILLFCVSRYKFISLSLSLSLSLSFMSDDVIMLYIRTIRRVYAECSPLFQLIKLINFLKADKNNTILEKIQLKSHTFHGFSFNVTMVYLNAYDPICKLNTCYTCNR